MAGAEAIAAEFFRWEVATAAAGWLLDINPFDEPNVSQAKQATRTLLDQYVATGELVAAGHTIAIDGVQIRMSAAASAVVGSEPRECLRALVHDGDYVAILPYLPPSHAGLGEALASLRHAIGVSTGCATMFGYGPRYLHSTGQLHKGGPNTGVFVLVTADGADDLAIPGEPFSFGVLESAQAIGDFLSLEAENRRAIHVHLPRRDPALVTRLVALLTGATAAQPA